jgi:hypothetical protein
MSYKLPEATKGQGCLNSSISLLLLMAIIAVLWLILFWGFKLPPGYSLFLAWAPLTVAGCLYLAFAWYRDWKDAGQVLLEVIPNLQKNRRLISGILFLLLGLFGAFGFVAASSKYAWLISSLLGLVGGGHSIVIAFSHIRAHENGIMAYRTLLRWKKIESYQWVSGNEQMDTLKLKYKGLLPGFMREGALPIPLKKKPELESILERYLSGPLPSTG